MDSPRRVICSFEFTDSGRRINAGSLDKILAKLPDGVGQSHSTGGDVMTSRPLRGSLESIPPDSAPLMPSGHMVLMKCS